MGAGPEDTPAAPAPFEPLGRLQDEGRNVIADLIPPLLDQQAVAVAASAMFQIRPDLEPQTAQDLNELIFQLD